MKLNGLALVGAVTLALASAPSTSAAAKSAGTYRHSFASVRTAELPREVARLVGKEKGQDREQRSIEIVTAAVACNPASAPMIVGAASRVAPDLAAKFAAAAAAIVSQSAPAIARAAAASAPAHAHEIGSAVARVRPAQYAQIAHEVSYAVPHSEQQVIKAIVVDLPNLKPFAAAASQFNNGPAAESPQPAATASVAAPTAQITVVDLLSTTSAVDSAAREIGMKTEDFLVADLTSEQIDTVTKVSGKMSAFGIKNPPASPNPNGQAHASPNGLANGKGHSYEKPGNGPKDKNNDGKPGNGPK